VRDLDWVETIGVTTSGAISGLADPAEAGGVATVADSVVEVAA
jgi:hypothetical protein